MMCVLKTTVLLSALTFSTGSVHAEPELNGTWRVKFSTEGSEDREAEITIDGLAGTWVTYTRGNKDKKDACVGRSFPISLSDSGSSTITLRVDASKSVAGCKNRTARLTIVDEKTLEGEFENGRVIKLVRS